MSIKNLLVWTGFKFQYDNTLREIEKLIEKYPLLFKFQYDNTLRLYQMQELFTQQNLNSNMIIL